MNAVIVTVFLCAQLLTVLPAFMADPGLSAAFRCMLPVALATTAFGFLMSSRGDGEKGAAPLSTALFATLSAILVADLASLTYGIAFAVVAVAAAAAFSLPGAGRGMMPRQAVRIFSAVIFLLTSTASVVYGAVPVSVGGMIMLVFSGMKGVPALSSLRFRLLIFLVPLMVLGCSPMKPSGGRYKDATVMFSLSGESLNLLRSENLSVRVRVHKVESGTRGDQEGNDYMFSADGAPSFRIDGVRMGLKDFLLDVLNQSSESVGHAEVRYLVRPGTQSLPEVRIKLVPPAQRRRLLQMNWQVLVKVAGEQPKTTYIDVKSTIDDYCISCHGADSRPEPSAKLVLSSFPFYYMDSTHEPAAIVRDSIFWMKAPDYPMPPPPMARVPQEKIDAVQKWLDDGLLKFPAANATDDLARRLVIHWQLAGTEEQGTWEIVRSEDPASPFPFSFDQAVIGGRYILRAEVFGVDGSKVAEQTLEHVVTAEGEPSLVIGIEGTAPDVSIPVVIEQ